MFKQMYKEKFMRFPEGRAKALTLSYDDGVSADKRLLKLFNKFGLKGAFNLNNPLYGAGKHGTMAEAEAFEVYKNCGQEIALHGDKHIFLTKVPLSEAAAEILDNRNYLENKYGVIVRGMAYAYGDFNQKVKDMLAALGVIYARTTRSTHAFDMPTDWLELNPTCHHTEDIFGSLTEKFLSADPNAEFKKREPLLYYVWGHSYEFDDNNNWNIIEDFAKKVSNRRDIWYAGGEEIYEYTKAYESLVYSADGERVYNPSHIPVWMDVRGKTYKIDAGATIKL
ncbi:MAG: polysaccharide deacetylase family protein [Clostridia bacterium]|nr:polysaccharide deacetylase family protein [Clostridia bacterium]